MKLSTNVLLRLMRDITDVIRLMELQLPGDGPEDDIVFCFRTGGRYFEFSWKIRCVALRGDIQRGRRNDDSLDSSCGD